MALTAQYFHKDSKFIFWISGFSKTALIHMVVCWEEKLNPFRANDELSRHENLTFYGPGYWGGYLGASWPILLCVTLCPLMSKNSENILALKGLISYMVTGLNCFRFTVIIWCYRVKPKKKGTFPRNRVKRIFTSPGCKK